MTKRKIKKLSKSSITIYRTKPQLSEAQKNRFKLKSIEMLLDLSQDLNISDEEIINKIIGIIYGEI